MRHGYSSRRNAGCGQSVISCVVGVAIAAQEKADACGEQGGEGEPDDAARLIGTCAVVEMSHDHRAGRTTNRVGGPRESVEYRKMFPTEVASQQVGCDVGFASEPDAKETCADESGGRGARVGEDERAGGGEYEDRGLNSLCGKAVNEEAGEEAAEDAGASSN